MASRTRRSLTKGEVNAARIETWIGRIIITAAVTAAAVSFWQIKWTAGLIGIPEIGTWGFPLIVDGNGTVLAGLTMSMHNRPLRQRVYVWSLFLVFVAISLGCNALHAIAYVQTHPITLPPAVRGAEWGVVVLLAAIPPVGAAIGMHAYAFTRRNGIISDLRASTAEARTVTREPAKPPPPRPAPEPAPVRAQNTPAAALVHDVPAAVNGDAPGVAPSGRPADVGEGSWRRHWGMPDFQAGWAEYQRLRGETGQPPSRKAVRDGARIGGDPTRVTRWLPLYGARYDAEHREQEGAQRTPAVNGNSAHAVNGAAPGARSGTPAHGVNDARTDVRTHV
jgi:hypothetical protein